MKLKSTIADNSEEEVKLKFIVADTSEKNQEVFSKKLYKLAVKKDFLYYSFKANKTEGWRQIAPPEDWPNISLGFLHVDYPQAALLGERLYTKNPFCRIVFYANGKRDVCPLLPIRPTRYLDLDGGESAVEKCLEEEYQALLASSYYFYYEDRSCFILLPYSNILFFTSQDGMVYCQTYKGSFGPIRRKLDEVEEDLTQGYFLRCHKGFLVRCGAILKLDKSSRELILSDGKSCIKVSRSHWSHVSEYFC